MTLSFLFWFFMLLWVLFGLWHSWSCDAAQRRWVGPGYGIVFLLFLIVGWELFGFPIQGETRPHVRDPVPARY